jgi:L-fucose isomerase-like protein
LFTDDPLNTFGTRAVAQVPKLQDLMQVICRNGFEHHAAMNASHCAKPVVEALENYMGWEVHYHSGKEA